MKRRGSFVTNSSSSSYIICFDQNKAIPQIKLVINVTLGEHIMRSIKNQEEVEKFCKDEDTTYATYSRLTREINNNKQIAFIEVDEEDRLLKIILDHFPDFFKDRKDIEIYQMR